MEHFSCLANSLHFHDCALEFTFNFAIHFLVCQVLLQKRKPKCFTWNRMKLTNISGTNPFLVKPFCMNCFRHSRQAGEFVSWNWVASKWGEQKLANGWPSGGVGKHSGWQRRSDQLRIYYCLQSIRLHEAPANDSTCQHAWFEWSRVYRQFCVVIYLIW